MPVSTRALENLSDDALRIVDPHGCHTIEGAKRLYVHGEIEVEELERRVELFLSGRPIAILYPGETILTR